MAGLEFVLLILSIFLVIMFVIMFFVVLRIWNLLQELLREGGFAALRITRAKKEANEILEGKPVFEAGNIKDLIHTLASSPGDTEATELIERLKGNDKTQNPAS